MKASEVKGHCQVCGRIQVVKSGSLQMVNHGYKVRSGYFVGVCSGHDRLALEIDRNLLDYMVSWLRSEAGMHEMKAERLQLGADLPEMVIARSLPYGSIYYHSRNVLDAKLRGTPVMKPWHQGSEMEQEYQLKMDIGHHESEARVARGHADGLIELAAKVHGQPLINRSEEEMAKREKSAAKRAPIPGAFRTKAAQKEALESLNRQYEKQTRHIKEHYLDNRRHGADSAAEAMYFALPYQLNHFRPKHAAQVRAVYPVMESAVIEIEMLVIQREAVKAMKVIK